MSLLSRAALQGKVVATLSDNPVPFNASAVGHAGAEELLRQLLHHQSKRILTRAED